MKFRYLVAAIIFLFCFHHFGYAQKDSVVKFGKLTPADFNLPFSSVIDSNTNAVIISDIGSTDFKGNKKGYLDYIYTRKVRKKILNKKGVDLASVKLTFY